MELGQLICIIVTASAVEKQATNSALVEGYLKAEWILVFRLGICLSHVALIDDAAD